MILFVVTCTIAALNLAGAVSWVLLRRRWGGHVLDVLDENDRLRGALEAIDGATKAAALAGPDPFVAAVHEMAKHALDGAHVTFAAAPNPRNN